VSGGVEAARPATEADVDRITELARAAIAELRVSKGGAVWSRREARAEPIDAALRQEVADADGYLVMAGTFNDAVVGYAVARVEVLRDGGRIAVLTDLYVEEDAREVGVGEALLGGVIEWAEARDCEGVDGFVLPGNRAAKNFFETWGLVARAILVHRPLPRS
jgi:ribosomal protein S18 acetylase RimI-like enzyme